LIGGGSEINAVESWETAGVVIGGRETRFPAGMYGGNLFRQSSLQA